MMKSKSSQMDTFTSGLPSVSRGNSSIALLGSTETPCEQSYQYYDSIKVL